MSFDFTQPAWLALALLAPLLVRLWKRRHPSVGHSNLAPLKRVRSINLIAAVPAVLFIIAFCSLTAAMARPQVTNMVPGEIIQARDVLFVVDISDNMAEKYGASTYNPTSPYGPSPTPATPTSTTAPTTPAHGCGNSINDWGSYKQDVAAYTLCTFANKSIGNRIGVEAFNGSAYIYAPLVTDLNIVIKKSYLLNQINETDSNSNFDGPFAGNEEGQGAFQLAVDQLSQYSQSRTKVIIMITDGDGSIDAARAKTLESQMSALGVHLYVLGPGSGSVSDDPPSNDINAMTAAYKGTIMDASVPANVQKVIDEVDALPTSPVQLDKHIEHHDVYQYLLVASLLLWLLFLGANAVTRQTA